MIKVRVLRAQRLGQNDIQFQVRIFGSEDGTTWLQVEGAPDVLTYTADEILAITDDAALSEAQKKQAIIKELIRPDIEGLKLSDAERALTSIDTLVGDWPITIDL
jgi:hypothetical protein